uniref:Uncharacterized protein n=1 Tax=Periophthalmus magnuspinnatus TaxID=409849 RepID=A0A3B4AKS5_9GOBI
KTQKRKKNKKHTELRAGISTPLPKIDYEVRSAASILASVKEQEARFEQLTRALEEERRNVNLQLERANLPANATASQPLSNKKKYINSFYSWNNCNKRSLTIN